MSHEGPPAPFINPDGSYDEAMLTERGFKLDLNQKVSHEVKGQLFEGTVMDMFRKCPHIPDMVNQVHAKMGPDAAISALQFVGVGAGIDLVVPLEAEEVTEGREEAESDVKKNSQSQIFPSPQSL